MKSSLLPAVLVGFSLLAGCGKPAAPMNGPAVAPANPGDSPNKQAPAPKPIVVLSKPGAGKELQASDLAVEFAKDKKAFAAKHDSQNVVIRGRVLRVDEEIFGKSLLYLEGAANSQKEVICRMSMMKIWNRALPGQQVLLSANCQGNEDRNEYALHDCQIIEVSGDAPVTISAENVAKAIQEDAEAAKKKYDGKFLIITGTAKAESLAEAGVLTFSPESETGRLSVEFDRKEHEGLVALKAGDSVRVLTKCRYIGKQFSFLHSLVLEK